MIDECEITDEPIWFSQSQALRIPVSSFVFFAYTVNLNYQSDLLSTGEEIGVVVLGPISNIIIQVLSRFKAKDDVRFKDLFFLYRCENIGFLSFDLLAISFQIWNIMNVFNTLPNYHVRLN